MEKNESIKTGCKIANIYTREIEESIGDDPLNQLSGYVLQNHHTLDDQASAVVEMLFLDSERYVGAFEDSDFYRDPAEASNVGGCSEAVYYACQAWIMDAVSAYQTNEDGVTAGIRQGLQDIADRLEALG